MIYLKVLYGHVPGGTGENRIQNSHSPRRDLKLRAPQYEPGALTTRLRLLVLR
jgi:hypothetical protein